MKLVVEDKGRGDWNKQFAPFGIQKHHSFEELDLSGYFAMGSFAFVKKCVGMGAKAFGGKDWFNWSQYAYQIGNELLNSDYGLFPAAELRRLKFEILGRYGKECKIFIRPDCGFKTFDGQVLDITEFDYFASMFDKVLSVISKPTEILGEWRFAVSQGGEILGKSLYRYQGELVSHPTCPKNMEDYVSNIAKGIKEWPDPAIVLDIAQLPDMTMKVIEANALSNSGLYAMEPNKIVEFIKNL